MNEIFYRNYDNKSTFSKHLKFDSELCQLSQKSSLCSMNSVKLKLKVNARYMKINSDLVLCNTPIGAGFSNILQNKTVGHTTFVKHDKNCLHIY